MALSSKTIQNLSEVLTPEVLDYIQCDERWAEFMLQEMIPDALSEKMGPIDEELKVELSFCIMDRIYLSKSK